MSSSVQFYLAIFIFLMTYAGIMSEKIHRTICALAGGGAMIYLGLVTQEQAITEFIDFNTLGLLTGMMILLSIVTAVGAALIDSVTAALLIAPMTISLCRMLRMSPVPILISEILMCNIGGTALMIGNPPNVMIGSATHLDFNDFLINLAPVVVITVIVILIAVLLIFKNDFSGVRMSAKELEKIDIMSGVEDKSIFSRSLMVLALTVLGFVVHSHFGLESATVAMTGGMAALLFCGISPEDALKEVDLDTLMFFMGLFILVGGMENAGVITAIAEKGIEMVDGDSHLITFLILLLSGVASAFVDNIPFTATMIPLIQDMQSLMNLPHADYMWWALATGACFGGNGTMIGASPNVIMVAIAAKEGFNISFTAFMKWCFPLMLLSLFVAGCYLETRYFIFGM